MEKQTAIFQPILFHFLFELLLAMFLAFAAHHVLISIGAIRRFPSGFVQLGSTNVQQFEVLKELPFYNWQKQPQLLPSGNCGPQQLRSHNYGCNFNTEIGLPQKKGQSYPLFDYEQMLFDTLQQHKHVWIKKATDSEF